MATLKGTLFVISAPTGGGKTTVARATLEKLAKHYNIFKAITYTTRKPRPEEVNERDYYFVSEEDFLHKKELDFFLETTFYDGHWYGSPMALINDLDSGKSFIIITDRPGAKIIKQKIATAVLIWLTVPSITEIADRLHQRSGADDEEFGRRITIAEREIDLEKREQSFDYHVMNVHFEEAVNKCVAIIEKTIKNT